MAKQLPPPAASWQGALWELSPKALRAKWSCQKHPKDTFRLPDPKGNLLSSSLQCYP